MFCMYLFIYLLFIIYIFVIVRAPAFRRSVLPRMNVALYICCDARVNVALYTDKPSCTFAAPAPCANRGAKFYLFIYIYLF